jgi:hypothetical protein
MVKPSNPISLPAPQIDPVNVNLEEKESASRADGWSKAFH